ncbi:MAG: NUDIX domain-containing protein [Bacteroidota bacterium]
MYKVFIQNKPLFFINSKNRNEFDGVFISESLANSNKRYVLDLLQLTSKNIPIVIFCENAETGISDFFSEYDYVEAAGGIVKRKDKYLFIKRNGVWDIPKGKIESGENPEIAALREIEEECGVSCEKVDSLIAITYHVYEFEGRDTIKKTFWYSLNYSGNKKLSAQKEEGITKAKWVNLEKVQKIKEETFASIADVMEHYFD